MTIGVEEESMIGLLRRKNPLKDSKLGRGVGSEAGYGHEREYVRLSLNAHSAHKLILDTSLGAPKIRSARTGSSDERTAIFECESRGNRFRYSNVERDILLIGERGIRCGERKVEIRGHTLCNMLYSSLDCQRLMGLWPTKS
jgi:hypothetical protein